MSGFPPPPSGTDLGADRGPELLAAESVTFAFAMTGVLLRFITRYFSGAGYWLDDWLIVPAAAMSIAILVIATQLDHIFGKHVWTVGYPNQVHAMGFAFADEILYNVLLGITKLSVLALYWRVFRVTVIRIPILVVAGLVISWVCASVVTNTLQCQPVAKDFNVIIPGTCIDIKAYFLGNAISNIITDAILLVLPMHPISKIQNPLSQKLLIAGTFVCGGLIIIFSCLRLNALLQIDLTSIDLTWNYSDTFLWSAIEANIAIFSVCLPTLRPFYRFLRTGTFIDPSFSGNSQASGTFGRNVPPSSNHIYPKRWESSHMEEIGRSGSWD